MGQWRSSSTGLSCASVKRARAALAPRAASAWLHLVRVKVG